MRLKQRIEKLDKSILIAVGLLTGIGLLAVSSATHFNQGSYQEVIKQLAFIIVGIGVMIGVTMINMTSIDDSLRNIIAAVLYCGIIGLLLIVIFAGSDGGGATRWIKIGGIGIQPSEFAKVGMVLVVAAGLDMIGDYINVPIYLIASCAIVGIPILLVYLQPNLSTTIIMAVIFAIQLYVADIDYRYVIIALVVAIPIIAGVVFYAKATVDRNDILRIYQKKRILALFYPEEYAKDEAYQTQKALQAVGSGKLFGKGLYKGILNRADYVPEPHTDFILAVIGEEFGFIGTFLILACYLVIAYRGLTLLKSAHNTFIKQTIVGIVSLFLFQPFVNIGVVTGILPNTGINLPFVSAGGSSYIANMIAIGILLNIDLKMKSGYRFR